MVDKWLVPIVTRPTSSVEFLPVLATELPSRGKEFSARMPTQNEPNKAAYETHAENQELRNSSPSSGDPSWRSVAPCCGWRNRTKFISIFNEHDGPEGVSQSQFVLPRGENCTERRRRDLTNLS